MAVTARGQTFSQNIVGYINQTLYQGGNLIANELGNSTNDLESIFPTGVPEGSTFTEWNPTTQQYLPASVYDTTTGWSIDYSWGYGVGALFNAPSTFNYTFVGSVWPGFDGVDPFVPPVISAGTKQLVACMIPVDASFYDVVGRSPENGESVTWLDAATQAYTTSTFETGSWDNGAPDLAVDQAAFFNLIGPAGEVVGVPEPTPGLLAGMGILGLAAVRHWNKRDQARKTG